MLARLRLGDRVIAPGGQGMTASESLGRHPPSPNQAILVDGLIAVFRTRRDETTSGGEHPRGRVLVQAYHPQGNWFHSLAGPVQWARYVFCHQFGSLQQLGDGLVDVPELGPSRRVTGNQNHVPSTKDLAQTMTERLPDPSLDSIARNGVSYSPTGGHCKAAIVLAVRILDQHQPAILI